VIARRRRRVPPPGDFPALGPAFVDRVIDRVKGRGLV